MDTVANRYAVALLSIAREEGKVQEYINEVEQILDVLEQNEGFLRILKDYGLTNEEKKETIDVCFKGKIREYILNTFYVVVDNNRGAIMEDVLSEFIKLSYKELNIKKGYVYTTISLTPEEIKQMEVKTSKMLNATVVLQNKIDKDLVGGFKIQVDDFIIDQSLKHKLADLKDTLLKKGDVIDGN